MSIEIIGAGFGRTGTLSLKYGLEMLGYKQCYHMMELMKHRDHTELWSQAHQGLPVDWAGLYEGYRATVDWPSCNLWRTLMVQYPQAKVILTLRDPDPWYDSIMATIYKSSRLNLQSEDPKKQRSGRWAAARYPLTGCWFLKRDRAGSRYVNFFTRMCPMNLIPESIQRKISVSFSPPETKKFVEIGSSR